MGLTIIGTDRDNLKLTVQTLCYKINIISIDWLLTKHLNMLNLLMSQKTERQVLRMERQALSILVENTPNVLSHVSGLFSRRGYNIDSISAGVTADPRFTRITIVSSGDELILEQIEKQLAKLEDVVDIKKLESGSSVCRELILIKIRVKSTERQAVISLAEIFKTKIVDVTNDSMMIELIGSQNKLEAFLELLEGYEILELARTGITGLTRGSSDVKMFE